MLKLERTVKVGDLLTSISVIITLIGVLIAWSQDRQDRSREDADKIRRAAALTLAKLERLQELTLWYYDEIQPLFVQVSEGLSKDRNIESARDSLWRQLDEARARSINRIHDEQIEQAYVELYGYYPDVHELLNQAIANVKAKDEAIFKEFQGQTEADVLSFEVGTTNKPQPDYKSAYLGNKLRDTMHSYKNQAKVEIDQLLKQSHDFILSVVLSTDEDILQRTRGKKSTADSPR